VNVHHLVTGLMNVVVSNVVFINTTQVGSATVNTQLLH